MQFVEAGVIPKFSVCDNGIAWFRERGRWLEGGKEPHPGMIVFFDWDGPDGPCLEISGIDRVSDRTGIVERVEGRIRLHGGGEQRRRVRHGAVPFGGPADPGVRGAGVLRKRKVRIAACCPQIIMFREAFTLILQEFDSHGNE